MTLQHVDRLVGLGRGLAESFDRSPSRFIEQQLLAEAGPREIGDVMNTLDTAGAQAGRSFDTAEGIYGRQTRALGQTLDADQQRAAQRRIGLSRALTSVDARNRAVSDLRQRTDIARSSAMDLRSVVEGSLLGARGAAAQLEGGREQDYQAAVAERNAKKRAGLGAIAGIGLNFIPGVGPLMAAGAI